MRESVAIVGYMGSGKSTLGRLLARTLNREFVDLDDTIARRAGKDIPRIFAEHGETAFRDLEHEALLAALEGGTAPSVVACGGGAVLRPENRALLRNVKTVFLIEDTGVLYCRTRTPGRPLRAASREEFESRYRERLPLYEEVADIQVEANGRPPSEVCEEVARCLSRP